ncbi:unnamed protein product, partial [Iphiclides podalirius]
MLSTLACWTFGVYVKLKGTRDPRSSVLVANYVSCLDSLAAAHVLGTISLRRWKLPPFFASTLGIRNAAQFVRKQHFADSPTKPILLQPEGGPTNGKALLKFTDWAFPIANRIQPVAITVERPLGLRVGVRGGRAGREGFPWGDALWFLCAPATAFSLRLLPPLERADDDEAAFAARLAGAIADALQIEATEFRWEEVAGARRAGAGRGQGAAGAVARGAELARMARQVREVLPAVPERDVLRDLARTRSVDVTISNFLEGVTPYRPEPVAEPRAGPSRAEPSPPHFPRSARERQLSFQERKAQMVAEARRRYVHKHGLDVALSC